jgi:hypothetical protein
MMIIDVASAADDMSVPVAKQVEGMLAAKATKECDSAELRQTLA